MEKKFSFFNRLSIRVKLLTLSVAVSTLMIIIGGIGVRNTYAANKVLEQVYFDRVVPVKNLKIIGDRYAVSIGDTLNRVLNGTISPQEARVIIDVAMSDIETEWQLYRSSGSKHEEEQVMITELEVLMSQAERVVDEAKQLLGGETLDPLKEYMTTALYPVIESISGLLGQIIDLQLREVKAEFETSKEVYREHLIIALITITVGVMTMIFGNIVLARLIVVSLRRVSGQLSEIVSGKADLTRRLRVIRMDEVGDVSTKFNAFMDNLLTLVRRVQHSGIQVTSSATAIASTSKQLERTIHDFGSFTNEVGSTAKEIAATSQELVNTMKEVSHVATGTAELATAGQSNLVRMETTMSGMEDASKQISSRLAVISEKAANITTVVTTITKIADQTNLLSLNASIEAEKAGEYGLGFAVVAREIRRLADQVALATLDIEQMVKEMKSAVSAGVMEMDKFSEEVRHDVEDVRSIGGQLTQIIDQVQTLLPQFETVHEGVEAQAQGAEQISDSMVQLTDAVDQTTHSLEATNKVVVELNESAKDLQKEVSGFKVDGDVGPAETEIKKPPEEEDRRGLFVIRKQAGKGVDYFKKSRQQQDSDNP